MKTKDLFYLIVIVVLFLVCIFKGSKAKVVTQQIENKHKIDSLDREIKYKQDSIVQLYGYIDTLNSYNDALKSSYNKNLIKLKQIQNEAHKKDSIINSFSVLQLDSFFSKRYNN